MAKSRFKVGQKVKIGDIAAANATGCSCCPQSSPKTEYLVITSDACGDGCSYVYEAFDKNGNSLGGCRNCMKDIHFTSYNGFKPTSNMNILERAALAFKGEPEKSFIKAGIIDSNEIPTDDGVKLVVARMLKDKDFATKFKSEVVDPILAEDAKDTK